MHTDDESEIEYTVVKRVASVTIESDSQVEAAVEQRSGRIRRKKRVVKRKDVNEKMDVDINVSHLSIINKGNIAQIDAILKLNDKELLIKILYCFSCICMVPIFMVLGLIDARELRKLSD